MYESANGKLLEWLTAAGFSDNVALITTQLFWFILLIILAVIVFYIARKVLIRAIKFLTLKSKTDWDDKLLEKKVFHRLAYLAPALVIYYIVPLIIPEREFLISVIETLTGVYMLTIFLLVISAVLDTINSIYMGYSISKARPIKSFLQVIKIFIVIVYIVLLITILFIHDGNFGWLAGLGAFSAVLLLVFKDPIMGFVGGLQLAANDMLRIGDWIEMPRYGADGTVIDIGITTVKVQNWNKTISTIPTYSLVGDSYKNWRGMEDSGGRRIKRSIELDMNSIKFCTPEMLERFEKVEHVSEYVKKTESEVKAYNEQYHIDNSILVNGRRQTNIGIFRAYLKGYLHHHPKINQDMTFLIRQLQPSEKGLPIEIYVFSKVQAWADYEDIQSDIFDHVLAVIPEFELKVFQNPTGRDFNKLLFAGEEQAIKE